MTMKIARYVASALIAIIIVVIIVFFTVPLFMYFHSTSIDKKAALIYLCDISVREKANIEDKINFVISSERRLSERHYVIHYMNGDIVTCGFEDDKVIIYKNDEKILDEKILEISVNEGNHEQ